jgi:TPP-dependent indolepyruvate ferredoxin oxidoreductase alpha subunit
MRLADDLVHGAINEVIFNSQPVSGSGVPDLLGTVPGICAGCPYAAYYYALRVTERRLGGIEVEVYGDLACPNRGNGECFSLETSPGLKNRISAPFVAVIGSPTFLRTKEVVNLASTVRLRGGAVVILDIEMTGVIRRSKVVALALGVKEVHAVSP